MNQHNSKPFYQLIGYVNDHKSEIHIHDDKISCKYAFSSDKGLDIRVKDIINISNSNAFENMKSRLIVCCKNINRYSQTIEGNRIFLYSILKRQKVEYQYNIMLTVLIFSTDEHCSIFSNKIQDLLSQDVQRPKSLAVFINPIGGFKKGVKIYYEKVEPLFRLAGITTDITVTKRRNEAREKLLSDKTVDVDGIVCVGGDGMLMELVNALLLKARRENGYSDSDHDIDGPEFETSMRVGIIPAGSTDSVAQSTTGSKDPITAALNIIIGANMKMDVLSVFHNNKFLRYNASLMGCGFYGNIVSESESLRWMGPKRYEWLGIKTFVNIQPFSAVVKYLPAIQHYGTPKDGKFCYENCSQCNDSTSPSSNDQEWVIETGQFLAVNSFLNPCRCQKSPNGPSPHGHLGNGCTDLVLVKQCSRMRFLQHLLRTASSQGHLNFDFIDAIRVTQFEFKLLEETGSSGTNINIPLKQKLRKSLSSLPFINYRNEASFTINYTADNDAVSIDQTQNNSSQHNHCRNFSNASTNTASSASNASSSSSTHSFSPDNAAFNTSNSDNNHTWNCDGEAMSLTSISCKANRQLIKLFANGVTDLMDNENITL